MAEESMMEFLNADSDPLLEIVPFPDAERDALIVWLPLARRVVKTLRESWRRDTPTSAFPIGKAEQLIAAALAEAVAAEREACLSLVEHEPEAEGPMPVEIFLELRKNPVLAFRACASVTKKSIAEAIRRRGAP